MSFGLTRHVDGSSYDRNAPKPAYINFKRNLKPPEKEPNCPAIYRNSYTSIPIFMYSYIDIYVYTLYTMYHKRAQNGCWPSYGNDRKSQSPRRTSSRPAGWGLRQLGGQKILGNLGIPSFVLRVMLKLAFWNFSTPCLGQVLKGTWGGLFRASICLTFHAASNPGS